MRITRLLATTFAALACGAAGIASAQSAQGYWAEPAGNLIWKNASGQCWRAGYWTPAMAVPECDGAMAPKPAPRPAAAPAPKPKPVAKPAAKPKVLRITSVEIFDFNKSTLGNEAKALLDKDVVAKLGQFATIQFINVNGHTDRLGSAQYNQKLSEKRAEAVKAYLVSKGVDRSKIETYGYGKTNPVRACPDQKNRAALIECLRANRRVEVEVQGTPR